MKKATLGRDALSLLSVLAVFPQWFSRDAAMEVGRTEVTKNWSPLGWEMVLDLLVRNGFIIANKNVEVFDPRKKNITVGTR